MSQTFMHYTFGSQTPSTQGCDDVLIDQIYAFESPTDSLEFNLNLEQKYQYLIYFQVVNSNNSVNILITIWGPENHIYNVFERDLVSSLTNGDWSEIIFGVAIAGVHRIQFNTTAAENINLYIRIEKSVLCLYDKVESNYIDHQLYYDVSRFSNGDSVQFYANLERNLVYKMFVSRVTAVGDLNSVEILNMNFTDPTGLTYNVYKNTSIPDVSKMIWTYFGAAMSGIYQINMKVSTTEPNINVAYMLTEDFEIAEGCDENNTVDDPNSNHDPSFSIPAVYVMIVLVAGAVITGVIALAFVYNKAKGKAKNDLTR